MFVLCCCKIRIASKDGSLAFVMIASTTSSSTHTAAPHVAFNIFNSAFVFDPHANTSPQYTRDSQRRKVRVDLFIYFILVYNSILHKFNTLLLNEYNF